MIAEKHRSRTGSQSEPGENMRPPEAACYLGLSESLLAKLRMRDKRTIGPKFIKVSGCIIYRRADLDDWLEQNSVQMAG